MGSLSPPHDTTGRGALARAIGIRGVLYAAVATASGTILAERDARRRAPWASETAVGFAARPLPGGRVLAVLYARAEADDAEVAEALAAASPFRASGPPGGGVG